jgi:hypothetical protein
MEYSPHWSLLTIERICGKWFLKGKSPNVSQIATMGCIRKKGPRGSDPYRIRGVGPLSARAKPQNEYSVLDTKGALGFITPQENGTKDLT